MIKSLCTSHASNSNKDCCHVPEQMAPEVIRSEAYGTSADVYSFGILFYCVVMGEDYPYHDHYLTPAQAALGVAKHGIRPKLRLKNCEGVQKVIEMCWASDAAIRPTMDVVTNMIMTEEAKARQTERNLTHSHSSAYSWLQVPHEHRDVR